MRIRVVQTPDQPCIDGIRLDHFVVGQQYDVGHLLASYFLAEGWAEPVDDPSPALVVPLDEFVVAGDTRDLPNVRREQVPPYYDGPAIALERRRRRRHF